MTGPDPCPRCGSTPAAGSPGGLCPRCLFRGVLDNGSAAPTTGGVLETLALTAGPIPRILLRDTEHFSGPGPVVRPGSDEMPEDGPRAGRLQLLGEIARGGMGAVLKGRDNDLGRDLAVKVLLERHGDDPGLTRRFVEEAQIAGQLQHPGIVPVYELGTFADRRPYFAMKLVKGRTLAEVMAERSKPSDDHPRLLAIFLDIAQTMAYAHARGVIHRDLKPSNVMVGSFGEVQVMDWGLAKVLPRGGSVDDRDAGKVDVHETVIATARSGGGSGSDLGLDLSHAGSVLGTPSYMAPEQARGENEGLDERADVFALGSILCEILTGQPAFAGRTSGEILRKSARGDVSEAYSRLDACGADPELIALARATLAPEADDRPRDAGSIVNRLNLHFAGVQAKLRAAELAHAAESARAEEAKRTAEAAEARARAEGRARRLTLALAASVLALVGLGGGGFAWLEAQKAARSAKLVNSVDTALAEARLLQSQARLAPSEDRLRWTEALSALKRAEGLLAGSKETVLARRVEDLKGQIEADRRQTESIRKLVVRLEAVRGNQADHDKPAQTDREYARAFLDYGLDLDAVNPKQAGESLSGSPATAEIAAAIDNWCEIRCLSLKVDSWRRLAEVARAVDPDRWRNHLRDLYGQSEYHALETLKAQAADAEALARQPSASLVLLAGMLARAGDRDGSVNVLRAAWRRFPGDYWVNHDLGESSWNRNGLERPDQALRFYAAAVAIRPGSAAAFNMLGRSLYERGDKEGAFTAFQEASRLLPDNAIYHNNLGYGWLGREKSPEHSIDEFRFALRLDPGLDSSARGLASALKLKGQSDAAIIAYRDAVQHRPDDANALSILVNSLVNESKAEEAIEVCRESIRVKPGFAPAYHHLGVALNRIGRRTEAIAAWQEAVRLDPKDRIVWYWLGNTANVAGEFAVAVDALRHAVEMPGDSIPGDATAILARSEIYLRLQPRLPAVLKGEQSPKDTAEKILYARMCRSLERYAASIRFFEEAFAEDPILAESPDAGRLYAVGVAVMGGCGPGKDDPPLDQAGRSRLLRKALDWLRQELANGKAILEIGSDLPPPPLTKYQTRADVLAGLRGKLQDWKSRRDLSGVRSPEGLAKLPEAERADWQLLWAEVDALLVRAGGGQGK